MEDIIRRCNLIVDLSKIITNKKILSKIIILAYNKFCNKLRSKRMRIDLRYFLF